jgi:hypothetical protein
MSIEPNLSILGLAYVEHIMAHCTTVGVKTLFVESVQDVYLRLDGPDETREMMETTA